MCLVSQREASFGSEEISSDTDRMIVDRCKAACVKACDASNHQLHETVLITVGQLARYDSLGY